MLTNVPQTLMVSWHVYEVIDLTYFAVQWAETHNNIFGRTVNPHNRSLTCGGSSGGEGSLVALRGSPLGIGSDIGGSVKFAYA